MTDIGDLMRFGNPSQAPDAAPFSDLAGTPTDPTAVTLVVQRPDGSQLSYGWPDAGADGPLTRESAGRFYVDVAIDQSGTWRFRLAGTGAVTAAAEGTVWVQARRVLPP
jgi:hypothetical protein